MMKRLFVCAIIACFGVAAFAAPPAGGSCCGDKAAKPTKAAKPSAKVAAKSHCGSEGKGAKKGGCSMNDPFLKEAARMTAASEGKKSSGCACQDKAAAKKAAAKPAQAK